MRVLDSPQSRFLDSNPHLKFIEDTSEENREKLRWAHKQHYIVLTRFDGLLFFTESDLEKAIMWWDKTEGGTVDV